MSSAIPRELKEVQLDLQSKAISKKIQAIHKVISFMNMGKNVSSLFFSVMKCLEIQNAEVKKLVYLYITQYSQELPQEAIMSVNCFVKDAKDKSNSLVRAMAIRTMGCLRVKDLNEYLLSPLMDALSDDDSYVKKVAVMTVPKLNELSPDLLQRSGVITKLTDILQNDRNAYVIANTILALYEIEKTKSLNQQPEDY
jgi:vesicle coat complex subunit